MAAKIPYFHEKSIKITLKLPNTIIFVIICSFGLMLWNNNLGVLMSLLGVVREGWGLFFSGVGGGRGVLKKSCAGNICLAGLMLSLPSHFL